MSDTKHVKPVEAKPHYTIVDKTSSRKKKKKKATKKSETSIGEHLKHAAKMGTWLIFKKALSYLFGSFGKNYPVYLKSHLASRFSTVIPQMKSESLESIAVTLRAVANGQIGKGKTSSGTLYPLVMSTNSDPSLKNDSKASAFTEAWADIDDDVKVDIKQADFNDRLNNLRQSFRIAFGKKAFKVRLVGAGVMTATVTTGVVNTVIPLQVSAFNEWSSFAALFDEFKVTGGVVIMQNVNTAVPSTNGLLVACYDPTDGTALTSTAAGCEYGQHELFVNTLVNSNAGYTSPHPTSYKFVIHPDPMYAGGASAEGMWQPVNNPLPVGWIKFYTVGGVITATNVASTMTYLDVEFRDRQ